MVIGRRESAKTLAHQGLFAGIDVGTGGVRALAATASGECVAQSSASLGPSSFREGAGIHEQSPESWWSATCAAAKELVKRLKNRGFPLQSLQAVAVDGTSGTLVCVDAAGRPVRPAMMYNDARASREAEELNDLAGAFCRKLGYRFSSSYALAKILWVQRNEAQVFERTAHFLHQADYVEGALTGVLDVSDYSNALKTGYDLVEDRWPDWIGGLPGVAERLPRIVPPGTVVGQVGGAAAESTGLPKGLPVVTGASDGTAACLASGVRHPGDLNTTLGTTLVFKGVSQQIGRHPDGLVYSHKLPGGFWLPGAASNTGGEWTDSLFAGEDLRAMDAAASALLPSPYAAYPLARRGERFPFLSADAEGFCVPEPGDRLSRYAACLQGVAFVERLGYQVLGEVMGADGGDVFTTGGGSANAVWVQCRADVTGRRIHLPAMPSSAFGSAILAAAATRYADLWEAIRAMVHVERTFFPQANLAQQYDELFERFCGVLRERGYL